MTLRLRDVADLENAWRDGMTCSATSDEYDRACGTISRYFGMFRAEGVPRKPKKRKPYRRFVDCPAYTGPDWIGKPA